MITFKNIRVSNFGVFGGEQCIVPSLGRPNNYRPITMVGGLNGRGKTSLLSAVQIALYGERSPSKGAHIKYTNYLKGLIHKSADPEEGTWVEVDLEVPIRGQNIHLTVRRSWRVANVRLVERLEIWRDGLLDPYLARTWDSHIEELAPPALAPLFFFDGERIGELADLEETPVSVQRAIRSLLGLEVADRLVQDLGRIVRHKKTKASGNGAQKELALAGEQLDQLDKAVLGIQESIAKLSDLIKDNDQTLKGKQEEYFQRGGTFGENRHTLKQRLEQLQQEHIVAKSEILSLAAGPLPLLIVLPLLKRSREMIEFEERIRQAESALPLFRERNSKLLNALSLDSGASQFIDQISGILALEEQELATLLSNELVFPLTNAGTSLLCDFLDHVGAEVQRTAATSVAEYKRIQSEQELLSRHELIEVNQEELDQLVAEVLQINQHGTYLRSQLAEEEKRLKELEVQRVKVTNQIRRLYVTQMEDEEEERVTRFAERAQEGIEAFRQRLIEAKVGGLARSITESLNKLTHKAGLVDRVEIDRITLDITLWDKENRRVPKASLSSGEKQILAISVLWGLAQASDLHLPVIIDTPMGRLDSLHRINFVQRYLPFASRQVIILSTDTEIIGTYWNMLQPYVGKEYLLKYDASRHQTQVVAGYFSGGEV